MLHLGEKCNIRPSMAPFDLVLGLSSRSFQISRSRGINATISLFQFHLFERGCCFFSRREIAAIFELIGSDADPSVVRLAASGIVRSLPDADIAVLVHGAWHVTLIPPCQPML